MNLLSFIITWDTKYIGIHREGHRAEVIARDVDECGRPVTYIRGNYRTINEVSEGTTYPGDVMRVHTKIAPGVWKEHYD